MLRAGSFQTVTTPLARGHHWPPPWQNLPPLLMQRLAKSRGRGPQDPAARLCSSSPVALRPLQRQRPPWCCAGPLKLTARRRRGPSWRPWPGPAPLGESRARLSGRGRHLPNRHRAVMRRQCTARAHERQWPHLNEWRPCESTVTPPTPKFKITASNPRLKKSGESGRIGADRGRSRRNGWDRGGIRGDLGMMEGRRRPWIDAAHAV